MFRPFGMQFFGVRALFRPALLLALLSVTAPLVSACGGTTVESSNTLASQPSITPQTTTGKAVEPVEAKRRPVDDPAHEVSSLPERKPQLSVTDEQMLENLKEEGIDVGGYEVQLAGLASRVCQKDSGAAGRDGAEKTDGAAGSVDKGSAERPEDVDEIVGAVAGQLVEQGKSKKSVADTAETLNDVAQKAYC